MLEIVHFTFLFYTLAFYTLETRYNLLYFFVFFEQSLAQEFPSGLIKFYLILSYMWLLTTLFVDTERPGRDTMIISSVVMLLQVWLFLCTSLYVDTPVPYHLCMITSPTHFRPVIRVSTCYCNV